MSMATGMDDISLKAIFLKVRSLENSKKIFNSWRLQWLKLLQVNVMKVIASLLTEFAHKSTVTK